MLRNKKKQQSQSNNNGACNKNETQKSYIKRDDASISSIKSTTSSVFSTSSRLSNRIPNPVKYFVGRAKDSENKSFASKILLKRSTLINFNFFTKKHDNSNNCTVPPNNSNSATLLTKKQAKENRRRNSTNSRLSFIEDHQENNVDNLIPIDNYTNSNNNANKISFDSKSEKVTSSHSSQQVKKERQRAKSCQEESPPTLSQLATKGSFHQLMMELPNSSTTNQISDLPLFKGLITTTLTTLHTRLVNECDRSLSMFILANNTPTFETKNNIPQQLSSIISDIYKMLEMVKWEESTQKKYIEIKQDIQQLEKKILDEELTITLLKDSVSTMKQIMNECVCQYYKVVERAIVIPSKGYKIEGMNQYYNFDISDNKTTSSFDIDHKDHEALWYRTYFMNQFDVRTFFGYDQLNRPILLSIKLEDQYYRIIYRTQNNPDQRIKVAAKEDDASWKSIIESNIPDISFDRLLEMNQDQMISSGIQNELLRLDENSLHTKYKFGVLLIKEGQTKEEEWLSNDGYDSEGFNEFLDIIGRKIELKGYMGWAAGLDTKGGDSGEYAYINVWNENTLAYHVSTLIPSKPGDKQQVQRKRHIGNDIVCIIFVEGKQPFNPTAIKSQFLHVFIVVHQELFPANNKKAWRVEIVYVEDVPSFGPSLPNKSALFFDRDELEKFLLAKLVNAEYAAFKSPKFALPMNRAREGIFSSLVGKGYNLLLTNTENDLLTLQQQESMTETNKPFQKHIRSASISSTLLMASSNSSSNMTREFSNLNKRRSIQDLVSFVDEDKKLNKAMNKKSTPIANKPTEGSKRSRSEQDLLNITTTTSLRNRAQNILTSIPGFSSNSNQNSRQIRRLSLSN